MRSERKSVQFTLRGFANIRWLTSRTKKSNSHFWLHGGALNYENFRTLILRRLIEFYPVGFVSLVHFELPLECSLKFPYQENPRNLLFMFKWSNHYDRNVNENLFGGWQQPFHETFKTAFLGKKLTTIKATIRP